MLKLTPVKLLASFVLVVGGACMAWLAFVVYLSYTLTFFVPVSAGDEIIGNISVLGVVPLIAGAILLFFDQRQKLGARLIFSGSVILTAYLGICYTRLAFQYMGRLEEILWFVVIPLVVLAVDLAVYKIYKLVLPVRAKAIAANAG